MNHIDLSRQKGVITIFIAMVMLILITLAVVAAFSLSTTNMRAVGNVQARDGGIAAAQIIIEQIVGEDFGEAGASKARNASPVDLNGDGVDDYLVTVPEPVCVRATQVSSPASSSVTLPGFSAVSAWNTIWEINATAEDPVTGSRVTVTQAVRAMLSQVEKDQVCP